jgi:hypothetical protein
MLLDRLTEAEREARRWVCAHNALAFTIDTTTNLIIIEVMTIIRDEVEELANLFSLAEARERIVELLDALTVIVWSLRWNIATSRRRLS